MEQFYQDTAQINIIAGNGVTPNDKELLLKQVGLIQDEIEEGEGNLSQIQADPDALRDDVMDVLFTAYGLGHRMGLSYRMMTLGAHSSPGVTTNLEAAMRLASQIDHSDVFFVARSFLANIKANLEQIALYIETDPDYAKVLVSPMVLMTFALGICLGYPVEQDYQAVVDSNMTKFDTTVEDAELTREKYLALGVETHVLEHEVDGVTLYVTKVTETVTGTDGKLYPEGKWLKSINWEDAKYTPLMELGQNT